MNHNLTEEQIEVIRPYFHGLTDEQFQEEINKFPLNNISEAMNDYIISFLDKAVDSKKKFYNELIEEENDEDQKMIWMAKISAINDLLTKIKTVIK